MNNDHNQPLRPRADGEAVWQPEKPSFLTPQFSHTTASGSRMRELGAGQAELDSGCQTLHHSDKLSGVKLSGVDHLVVCQSLIEGFAIPAHAGVTDPFSESPLLVSLLTTY